MVVDLTEDCVVVDAAANHAADCVVVDLSEDCVDGRSIVGADGGEAAPAELTADAADTHKSIQGRRTG